MRKIYVILVAAVMNSFLLLSCESDENRGNSEEQVLANVTLVVPTSSKTSLSTYATEDGTVDENKITELELVGYNSSNAETFRTLLTGSSITTPSAPNGSKYNLTVTLPLGVVKLEAFANSGSANTKTDVTTITSEIPVPSATSPIEMFGTGTVDWSVPTAPTSSITVKRNLSKVRVRITKDAAIDPSTADVIYMDCKVQILNVPNKAAIDPSSKDQATEAGYNYLDYGVYTGTTGSNALRWIDGNGSHSYDGGEVLHYAYIYPTYSASLVGTYQENNTTQIKVTICTQDGSNDKVYNDYVYVLPDFKDVLHINSSSSYTESNYVYDLTLNVIGQGAKPKLYYEILDWNDVVVAADILGTYLSVSETSISPNTNPALGGYSNLVINTDATMVKLDWSDANIAQTHLDTTVTSLFTDGDGYCILPFKFNGGTPVASSTGKLYVTAGNITKTITINF